MLNNLQQGGIYKLPFPYTDLSDQKYRPALAITAPVPPAQRLALGVDDFDGAPLAFKSFVRPEKSMLLTGQA